MPELAIHIGVIGSGKDYQSKKLVNQGYVQINFADALRDLAWDLLGWKPKNDQEYNVFKSERIMQYNRDEKYTPLCRLTGREFLQFLGSAMRKYDPNFWINQWERKVISELMQGNNVVCSDLRYLNELAKAESFIRLVALNQYNKEYSTTNVKFTFCNYKSDRYEPDNPHESEHLAQSILKDYFKDCEELPLDYVRKLLEAE